MANEEQLAILREGVDVWNQWMEENPDAVITLHEANLFWINLRAANLAKVGLSRVLFKVANLSLTDLFGSNLKRFKSFGRMIAITARA